MARKVYELKRHYDCVTQGSVINHCIAENYNGKKVWGLVVTPRCDLSHDGKVSTIHYIPMVLFCDWLQVDYKIRLHKLWRKSQLKKLRNMLKGYGMSESILESFSREMLLTSVEKNSKPEDLKAFSELYDSLCSDSGFPAYVTSMTENQKKSEIKDLLGHKMHAFYYIESWDEARNHDGYVILLREIHRLSKGVCARLTDGIFETEVNQDFFHTNDFVQSLSKENLYCVESQVCSPYIEHIMQEFAYNFTRIGTEDIENREELVGQLIQNKII